MFDRDESVGIGRETAPWVISGIGLVLAGLSLWYLVVTRAFAVTIAGPDPLETAGIVLRLIEIGLLGSFSVVLVYAGYWLATQQFLSEQLWWTSLWTIIGLSGVVGLVALVQSFRVVQGQPIEEPLLIQEMLLAAGGGGLGGLLIGVSTLRSARHAQESAKQRDALAFSNQLLRHNVLNGMQVIQGYTGELQTTVTDEDARRDLERVQNRSDEIVDLIESVRILMVSVAGETDTRAVNLSRVATREVALAEEAYEDAVFETEIEDGVHVRADDLLSAVLENLLSNAVHHNDRPEPTVTIRVVRRGDSAVLEVADDGPGVPDDRKEAYFDPGEQRSSSSGQGIGLYLVHTLVSGYGGDVSVDDNEPRGAIFRLELPLA